MGVPMGRGVVVQTEAGDEGAGEGPETLIVSLLSGEVPKILKEAIPPQGTGLRTEEKLN